MSFVTKIVLSINDKEISLSIEEAQQLYRELDSLLIRPLTKPSSGDILGSITSPCCKKTKKDDIYDHSNCKPKGYYGFDNTLKNSLGEVQDNITFTGSILPSPSPLIV